ncbi:MAG: DUF1330 domain-containing protein [Egibacteraceae bacterium]
MSAYVIVIIEVTDPQVYEAYRQCAPAAIEQYGGPYLVRGGQLEVLGGDPPAARVVVPEVPQLRGVAALVSLRGVPACAAIRHRAAVSRLFAVDGV